MKLFVAMHGVPHYLHSDQGANFVSTVIQSLCSKLGIKRTQTTPYHPQGNGQVERFNRTLEAMLSKVVADNQKDWDEHLQTLLFAYRTAVHDSTGLTYSFFCNVWSLTYLTCGCDVGSYTARTVHTAPSICAETTTICKSSIC